MGNIFSDAATITAHPLALVAVANSMRLSQRQLLELRSGCTRSSYGQKRSRRKISRMSFVKAMARANVVDGSKERDILHQLFTMWDSDGEERLDFVEFLAGISPLACRKKPLWDTLAFGLKLMDLQKTNRISHPELVTLLNGINATASYFGDKVLSKQQVQVIADSVFISLGATSKDTVPHTDCVEMLNTHPMVEQFVLGLGQYKYVPEYHAMLKEGRLNTNSSLRETTFDTDAESGVLVTPFSTDAEDSGTDHCDSEAESGVIVGVLRDENGDILATEIGASSCADGMQEI